MKQIDPKHFHRLFGVKRPRISYQKKDFVDYLLMIVVSASVIALSYRQSVVMSALGIGLCVIMIAMFAFRHGAQLTTSAILKSPQDLLYMVAYKVLNIKPMYVFALGLVLLENYLIVLTPGLPHHVEWVREAALLLFYAHFLLISAYRTRSLIDHLRKRALVREVLMQSPWRSFIARQPSVVLEIVHAYFTGILTHLILLAPWFIVITHLRFSIIFLPIVCWANVLTHARFLKAISAWFYRDHWLGHNSEIDFIYLHGSHHDAIPSGLIGVAGNGFLEGFFRNVVGYPTPFYNPITAFIFYTLEVHQDIVFHQYIPGIFPKVTREFQIVGQHSTHHFGRLEPYGFGIKLDQAGFSEEFKNLFKKLPDEFSNSIGLDERLTGFEWDNPRYRWYLDMRSRYES